RAHDADVVTTVQVHRVLDTLSCDVVRLAIVGLRGQRIRVVDVNKRIVQQGHSVNRGRFSGATAIIPYEDSAFGNDHGAAGDGNPFPRFRLCVDLDDVSRRNLTGRVVEKRHLVPPKSTFQELLYGIVQRLISIQSV